MARVYPRTHGGTLVWCCNGLLCEGLSPYTRGNLEGECVSLSHLGSIPVHTGEPIYKGRWSRWDGVYPRTHGGTRIKEKANNPKLGLSPYTRGTIVWLFAIITKRGLSRTHGGTTSIWCEIALVSGLSPYTRGNRGYLRYGCVQHGSIPYTRGNRYGGKPEGKGIGSIPVHTGEPKSKSHACLPLPVYPRTHGGTRIEHLSISVYGVYPRTHGGTILSSAICAYSEGLSPYTRGNLGFSLLCAHQARSIPVHTGDHLLSLVVDGKYGSIPVHTGEPQQQKRRRDMKRVYPRTHGGTDTLRGLQCGMKGLSPYTRGNHTLQSATRQLLRSIPVHTGEPISPTDRGATAGVYPRTHGGTGLL